MKSGLIALSAIVAQLATAEVHSHQVINVADISAIASASSSLISVDTAASESSAVDTLNIQSTVSSGWNVSLKNRAIDYITSSEVFNGSIHLDERGAQCIGYGFNVDRNKRGKMTREQAKLLLVFKVDKFIQDLKKQIPWMTKLDIPRQAVLINMAFQMGVGSKTQKSGLMGFQTTLGNVERGNYKAAAEGMMNSAWARQTPNRARRVSKQMETGQWVIEGHKTAPFNDLMENLYFQLTVDEGYVPYAYKCTAGLWTVGIGFMVDPAKRGAITVAEGETLVDMQMDEIVDIYNVRIPWWANLAPARKVAMVWFGYKVSAEGFLTFNNALAALKAGDFQKAANEMLDSVFAKGAPAKARRITNMIRSGVFEEGPVRATLQGVAASEELAFEDVNVVYDAQAEEALRF